jgi:hypothetical protein
MKTISHFLLITFLCSSAAVAVDDDLVSLKREVENLKKRVTALEEENSRLRKEMPGLFAQATAKTNQTRSLVGKWVGKAPNGDKITYVFKEDDTVIWTVDTANNPGSITAKYTVDYTTTPIHIDIFEFSFPSLKGYTFLGVLEFDGTSSFRLKGEPRKQGLGAKRPERLGDDAILFSKVP